MDNNKALLVNLLNDKVDSEHQLIELGQLSESEFLTDFKNGTWCCLNTPDESGLNVIAPLPSAALIQLSAIPILMPKVSVSNEIAKFTDGYQESVAVFPISAQLFKFSGNYIVYDELAENKFSVFSPYILPEDVFDIHVWGAVHDKILEFAESASATETELLYLQSLLHKMLSDTVRFGLFIFRFADSLYENGLEFVFNIDIQHVKKDGIRLIKSLHPRAYSEYNGVKYPAIETIYAIRECLKNKKNGDV